MRSTLTDFIKVIIPHLTKDIAPPEALSKVQKIGNLSAPIHRAGFEFRLDTGSRQLDLQQGILAKDNERLILLKHITNVSSSNSGYERFVWNRIRHFCELWSDSSSCLYEGIIEIWLEFDLDDSASSTLVPSVFIGLNQDITDSEKLLKISEIALEVLWGQQIAEPLKSNLRRCFTSCLSPARITHLGMMLSRQIEALRINVSKLSPDGIASYLQEVGWPESADEVENLAERLLDFVDQVKICLDVGITVYPKLGLECFFNQQNGVDPLWFPFLDELVERGLCSIEKREALLAWPGYTTPNSSKKFWPSSLIAESILKPPDRLSVLERGLSHIKLIYQPQKPLEAKGYIGFIHQWLEPNSPEDENQVQDKIASPNSSAEVDKTLLDSSITAATNFLLSARNQGGWWRDFEINLKGRKSDEWVTAYIATALAALPDRQTQQAANRAWSILVKRRQLFEGWGYNPWSPADADSTGWGLRLATAVGELGSERARGAINFLAKHLQPNGGFATYILEELAPESKENPVAVQGWCSVHTCVTAAVAGLDSFREESIPFLRNAQREDGSWTGYWSVDDEYPTALASEALTKNGSPSDYQRVQLAMQWAANRVNSNGAVYSATLNKNSAFATAWCVRTLALANSYQDVRTQLGRAVNWLIANQKPDGSWHSSTIFRFPETDIVDPENHPSEIYLDNRRLFTTATVMAALLIFRTRCSLWEI